MEQKEFHPEEWLPQQQQKHQAPEGAPGAGTETGKRAETCTGTESGTQAEMGSREGTVTQAAPEDAASIREEVESVIKSIEAVRVDITTTYTHWRNIGFGLASAFGAAGRDYFHRISCFYPRYEKGACDKQYDQCLKARGNGITLRTFFYYAKEAGVPLSSPQSALGGDHQRTGPGDMGSVEELEMGKEQLAEEKTEAAVQEKREEQATGEQEPVLPTLPAGIYEEIPDFLKKVVALAVSDEERDILLLGSLVALSACLPSFYGIYDGKKVFANLFLFITAQASAGKGRLVHCKQLVLPVHRHMREQARLLKKEYNMQLAEYNQKDVDGSMEKPGKPAEKMLLIPANNSTTGVFQLLHENEGRGIIFETEGDTLAQAFKSDYGNYSDGFRKAFHHETISYYRRTDREYVDIESPCISTLLSGTPKQVSALIPNAENGLFSRFIFYYMNVQPVWKDVFAYSTDGSLDAYFGKLGQEFYQFYKHLEEQQEAIEFQLTAEQQAQFNQFFSQVQGTYISLKGLDYLATVRRLGLIAFRICMIFSALRIMEHGTIPGQVVCEDRDFRIGLEMSRKLVQHAARVFSELPEEEQLPKRKNLKERFFELLPKEFSRQQYLEVARKVGIPERTAQRHVADFCKSGMVLHEAHDRYLNVVGCGV